MSVGEVDYHYLRTSSQSEPRGYPVFGRGDRDGAACRQARNACGRLLLGVAAISEVHGDIADLLKDAYLLGSRCVRDSFCNLRSPRIT